ncbi:molecular chaperone HtpG [Hypericibacter terrae]|nr:molecular chaperone HtpG [Hypericibacter terrae]
MTHQETKSSSESRHGFQAEVGRLLDIVAHSLYSERAVFLRELISNAADACDKLRYLSLTHADLIAGDPELKVVIRADAQAGTLTIADNGIGMNREDLVENLGTIARSGTAAFLKQATGDAAKDLALIGQFGVGFYAAFMVADQVEVVSRKAGETEAWRWSSDGRGEFEVVATERDKRGSDVILHLKADAREFLERDRLKKIVTKYSDHIPLPIFLAEDGKGSGGKEERLNEASALWMKPKSEITEQGYAEFYRHSAHAFDKPWMTLHFKVEGVLEYAGLLFVPSTRPFDLFDPDRKNRLKLYVKRVFITDSCDELVPPYLRFLRGVVDSSDLPLNISREMLQHNPVLAKMRAGITKRVLGELEKRAKDEPDAYADFWNQFGAVLKEGLYEQNDQGDALLSLARFRSTASDKLVSLADYLARMKPGQEAIYYITGETLEAASRSPHLEGFRARDVEVLLLTDPIDEFWVPAVGAYKEKPLRSVTRGGAELEKIVNAAADKKPAPPAPEGIDGLIALFKLTLKDAVKDVRSSQRLTESTACLVAEDGDLDINLERLLRQHKRLDTGAKRVLEINPQCQLVAALTKRLKAKGNAEEIGEAAWLILDQARILQGETLEDPVAFARRQSEMMRRALEN